MSPGRHFLQIPGPTNIPPEVLRALGRDIIDHRGSEFAQLTTGILEKLGSLVGSKSQVIIYPSSGTGAWEAALVNVLSPSDVVLVPETGFFSAMWANLAENLGFVVRSIPGDWRRGVAAEEVRAALESDSDGSIKAIAVVHNETSTGARSDIVSVRRAIDETGHDAILLVDTISSLGSSDYRHDEWGVDVMVGCSQKGLQLPPGIGINVLSERALAASQRSTTPKGYWDWGPMLQLNPEGFFPYTPPTNMLFALDASLNLLLEEGMPSVVSRHQRLAAAVRLAVDVWGLEVQCESAAEQSDTVTAVRMPEGADSDALRKVVLDRFDTSLGTGLGKLRGEVFRIGHLGALNDPMVFGTLGAIEAGLHAFGAVPKGSGVAAAVEYLAATPAG